MTSCKSSGSTSAARIGPGTTRERGLRKEESQADTVNDASPNMVTSAKKTPPSTIPWPRKRLLLTVGVRIAATNQEGLAVNVRQLMEVCSFGEDQRGGGEGVKDGSGGDGGAKGIGCVGSGEGDTEKIMLGTHAHVVLCAPAPSIKTL